ncbi:MAG: hypothetical protein QM783_07490 [Phycisphaerales bacterium]
MSSVKHAVELMKFSHGMIDKMLETIPADKCLHQQHGSSNHVVWTLGHLACTYAWFATTIDADAYSKSDAFNIPESWGPLFGMGSKVSSDASVYPPLADVRKRYDTAFAGYVKMVEGLSEADAWTPCATDTGGFAKSKIDGA